MESLTVADIKELPLYSNMLTVFTNEKGGILDDLIISKQDQHLYVVSNAGCADKDLKHMQDQAKIFSRGHQSVVKVEKIENESLLALQGPKAERLLMDMAGGHDMRKFLFMESRKMTFKKKIDCLVSRSGYTGEDGFEVRVPSDKAAELAMRWLRKQDIKFAGLGARDALRLEAGMCLYGHDIDDTTTPVEAGLSWLIGKRRRVEGGFPGADVIMDQLKNGVERRRVGLIVEGAPAREGAIIFNEAGDKVIGKITSGCPSPCLKKNIAMGYVAHGSHKIGTPLKVQVRQRMQNAVVSRMPFVPSKYKTKVTGKE